MKIFKKALSAASSLTVAAAMLTSAIGSLGTAVAADKTAIDIVNDMGLGWNLGNTFDSWGVSGYADKSKGYVDNETCWGNARTTQAMIDAVKASGFNSIRIPVTWGDNTDSSTYDINDKYLARIKEVIDYCYKDDMYVIINMHWDWEGNGSGWLNKGSSALPQFKAMWGEIASYFANYDDHLVFESMNEVTFDYNTLNSFNQSFVDVVRGAGGNNKKRLLVCSGANADLDKTCSSEYKVPTDDMVAVDIHYYTPPTFCVAKRDSTWGYASEWGSNTEKNTLTINFNKLKSTFVDKGIPVIVGEYGVLTDEGKKVDSIHEFNKAVASTGMSINGIATYLWDDSDSGGHKYFSRKNLTWHDAEMGKIYAELSGSSYVPPTTDWAAADFAPAKDDDGNVIADTYKVSVGSAQKIKLEFDKIPSGISKAMVGYWDENGNNGKGKWDQTTVAVAVVKDKDGNVEVQQLDSKDNVVNYGYIELPEGVSTQEIQIQFIWQQNDEAYPTLTNASVSLGGGSDDPVVTTAKPVVTTTAKPVVTTTAKPVVTTTTAKPVTPTTTTEKAPVTTPVGDVKGNAYLAGGIGAEQCWGLDQLNDLSSSAAITGDGQYSVEWVCGEGGGTDTVQFLAVMIEPAGDVENFTIDSLPELSITLDEVWIDGVQLKDYTPCDEAINTRYYEGKKPGMSRIYLHDDWGTGIEDLPGDTEITKNIKVVFTIKGVDAGYTDPIDDGELKVKLWGDANDDGEVGIADATAVLQSIGNPDKYALSPQGAMNADVVDHNGGKGISAKDSLAIQMYDAGILKDGQFPITSEEMDKI